MGPKAEMRMLSWKARCGSYADLLRRSSTAMAYAGNHGYVVVDAVGVSWGKLELCWRFSELQAPYLFAEVRLTASGQPE